MEKTRSLGTGFLGSPVCNSNELASLYRGCTTTHVGVVVCLIFGCLGIIDDEQRELSWWIGHIGIEPIAIVRGEAMGGTKLPAMLVHSVRRRLVMAIGESEFWNPRAQFECPQLLPPELPLPVSSIPCFLQVSAISITRSGFLLALLYEGRDDVNKFAFDFENNQFQRRTPPQTHPTPVTGWKVADGL